MAESERRHDTRYPIAKLAKLRCVQTGRFLPGRTMNISSSGTLLEVDRPSLLIPGQRLAVGIAWGESQGLLQSNQMQQATVTRSIGQGMSQQVAVRFDHPLPLKATA